MKLFASSVCLAAMMTAAQATYIGPGGSVSGIQPGDPVDSNTVIGRTLAARAADLLNVKDYGAKGDGVTDDSAALIAADAAALVAGKRFLYFPSGNYYAPNLGVISLNYLPQGYLPNTILIGEGQITGSNGYRRVLGFDAQSAANVYPADIIPSQHLKAAATKALSAPLVVDIMGDSTCQSANNVAPSEILSASIYQKLLMDNPGRSITFNNRCIGGRSWPDANGTPTGIAYPPWYTNTSATWLSYVQADAPDLLIFNFGMNPDNTGSIAGGAGGVDLPSFHGVLNKVAAFTKVPSIIFATPMQPSLNPTANFGGYPLDQEERQISAGFQRSYARANGYGVLDINRRFRMMRDGVDPTDQRMAVFANAVTGQALPYTPTQVTEGDFDIQSTFVGQAQTLWSNVTTMTIQLGNRNDNILVLSKDGGTGNLTVAAYEGTSYIVYGFVSSVAASPASGDISLRVTMKRGRMTLLYNGAQIADSILPVFGGRFSPSIKASGPSIGSATATITAAVGLPASYMPNLTDADIYQNNATLGGNVVNHANSLGIAAITNSVVMTSRLSVADALNPVNPGGTAGVIMDFKLPDLGTASGAQSVLGGFTVNSGNTQRIRWLANRSAAGTNYLTGEIVEQASVDSTLLSATVYNPSSFPQGWSARTGGVDRLAVDAAGNVKVGGSNLANATGGFTLVSTTNGAPTGVPSTTYGLAPIAVDTANNKACFYVNSAWKCATLN